MKLLITQVGGAFASNTDAYNNFLKLPSAGGRSRGKGSLDNQGYYGFVWSSSVTGFDSHFLGFNAGKAYTDKNGRANGVSIRCLKD